MVGVNKGRDSHCKWLGDEYVGWEDTQIYDDASYWNYDNYLCLM